MATAGVEVFASAGALMRAAADGFVRSALAATQASGRFVVALAGGSTPAALYALLATETYVARVDWTRVQVFFGDERCVPPDDPASNYRMAREQLLARVPLPDGSVHRIRGEDDGDAAAAAYERELRATLATADGPPRTTPGARLDLVLLGLGHDGHTASLFPGTASLRERVRWVVAHQVAAAPTRRITMTPILLNAAAEVTFVVAGTPKAAALRRILGDAGAGDPLPAQVIAPAAGRLRWLVDAAAAAELPAAVRG